MTKREKRLNHLIKTMEAKIPRSPNTAAEMTPNQRMECMASMGFVFRPDKVQGPYVELSEREKMEMTPIDRLVWLRSRGWYKKTNKKEKAEA